MIIRPSTPGGSVVFCDDIREEVLNKRTLVGAYSGNMIASGQWPVVLPKFGFLISYFEKPGESDEPVKFTIDVPSQEENQSQQTIFQLELLQPGQRPSVENLPAINEGLEQRIGIQFATIISPFVIFRQGTILVRAFRGSDEIRLGSLRVDVVDDQNAIKNVHE